MFKYEITTSCQEKKKSPVLDASKFECNPTQLITQTQ